MPTSFQYQYDFFISFTEEDSELAHTLTKLLIKEGFRVSEKPKFGESYRKEINKTIKQSYYILVIGSEKYYSKITSKEKFRLQKEFTKIDIEHEDRDYNPLIWLNLGLDRKQLRNIDTDLIDIVGIENKANTLTIQEIVKLIKKDFDKRKFQIQIINEFSNALKLSEDVKPKSANPDLVAYEPLAKFVDKSIKEWVKTNKPLDKTFFEHLYKLLVFYIRKGLSQETSEIMSIYNEYSLRLEDKNLNTLFLLEIADYERKTSTTDKEMYLSAEKLEEAKSEIEELVMKDSDWSKPFIRVNDIIALTYYKLRLFDKAIDAYQTAINYGVEENLKQKNKEKLKLDFIYYNLALAYICNGEIKKAKTSFEKSKNGLETTATSTGVRNIKGEGFINFGQSIFYFFDNDLNNREYYLNSALNSFSEHSRKERRRANTIYHLILHSIQDQVNIDLIKKQYDDFLEYKNQWDKVEEYRLADLIVRCQIAILENELTKVEFLSKELLLKRDRLQQYSLELLSFVIFYDLRNFFKKDNKLTAKKIQGRIQYTPN